jgi:TetR/AcrR family transcriptional regulator
MALTRSTTGAQSILEAALALFSDVGFDGASIADIAEKAGVCKANVFHHFASKEELYAAVIRSATAAHADYAEELFRAPGSSADKVRRLVDFEIHHMLAHRQRTRLLLRETSDGNHVRGRRLARTVFQRNFTAMVNIFEQGRERGEFHPSMDPAAAAMLLCGAAQCFFNYRESLRECREASGLETPEAYSARVAALILTGVVRREGVQSG